MSRGDELGLRCVQPNCDSSELRQSLSTCDVLRRSPAVESDTFLKPGFCKFKRTNKMDFKARGCSYLSPARKHPSESKCVLVRTGKVIIARNVTWAHVPLARPPIVRSTPLVEGGSCDHGKNREASSFGGDTE